MEAFRKQVSTTETLLEELADSVNKGSLTAAQAQTRFADLISEESVIRPFLAALATSRLPLNTDILQALKSVIESKPQEKNTWHTLLTKNVLMSALTGIAHERSGNPQAAEASRMVTFRMQKIVSHIQDSALSSVLKTASKAIDSFENKAEELDVVEKSDEDYWHKFFSQWKYSKEDLKSVQKHLLQKS